MKKPMTLAEQVRDAQKTVNSWSRKKRESVRLEGSILYKLVEKDAFSTSKEVNEKYTNHS